MFQKEQRAAGQGKGVIVVTQVHPCLPVKNEISREWLKKREKDFRIDMDRVGGRVFREEWPREADNAIEMKRQTRWGSASLSTSLSLSLRRPCYTGSRETEKFSLRVSLSSSRAPRSRIYVGNKCRWCATTLPPHRWLLLLLLLLINVFFFLLTQFEQRHYACAFGQI